jgi:hypothetical protein
MFQRAFTLMGVWLNWVTGFRPETRCCEPNRRTNRVRTTSQRRGRAWWVCGLVAAAAVTLPFVALRDAGEIVEQSSTLGRL